MPSPYLCERFHPTRGCVSLNFRPDPTFSKVAGRVRTADLQTRRLPLNPLLHGGLTLTTSNNFDLKNLHYTPIQAPVGPLVGTSSTKLMILSSKFEISTKS